MTDIDWSNVKLVWFKKPNHIENYEELVRKDCERSLWGLSRVSDLTFHTICLSNSFEYDIITVWGEDSDETLYCDYDPKPTWLSLKEWENSTKL